MSNNKGFKTKESHLKSVGIPSDPSCGDMSGKKNTEYRDPNQGEHDFNYAAKVTQEGSDFHDYGRRDANLHGNFAQKDASIAYLQNRNKQGQEIRHFAGGNKQSIIHTNNGGVTAYNGNPIRETYTPATSNKVPSADPVRRTILEKKTTVPSKDQGDQTDKLK